MEISSEYKTFDKKMSRLRSLGYRDYEIMTDFIDLSLFAFLRDDENYMKIVHRYPQNASKPKGDRPADIYAELLAELILAMEGDPMKDVIGDLYMQYCSSKMLGQFFSPHNVCGMMAQITIGNKDNFTACDPACGSGRMMLALAKINRNGIFHNFDIDSYCTKMATLNMFLNGLNSINIHANTLTVEVYGGWFTDFKLGFPRIGIIPKEKCIEFLVMKERAIKEQAENPHPIGQLTLF